MMNLSAVIEHSTREHADKTAIIFGETRIDYGTLNAMANQVANGLLKAGIGKGDKVALSCPNLPYFPMVYYGILKVGAVVVPLNVLLKSREIAYHLENSDAKAYFCFEGTPELPMAQEGEAGFKQAESCKDLWIITAVPGADSPVEGASTLGQMIGGESPEFNTVQCKPDETAAILYTSGTTGQPKGAELSHANILMNVNTCGQLFNLKHEDIQLVVLPLFHSLGQVVQMSTGFSRGNSLVILPRFSPDQVLMAMQQESVTLFAGVPTMFWQLLTYEDKEGKIDVEKIAGTLRICASGGAPMPLEIMKGFEEKYQVPILEGYGLSETSPAATFNHLHKVRKPGSIGTPVWGIEVKVVDKKGQEVPAGEVGEIVIRGHNVMKGYYNKPEATASAIDNSGWFHTGDLAKKDEEGYLFIVDRLKDMIIRGGYNVYPREIEEVLLTHPSISMAAVIGVPHDRHGEEIKAYVMLKNGENVSAADIVQWAKNEMAGYKYPRIVELRDALPMTATGKILKKDLKEEVLSS